MKTRILSLRFVTMLFFLLGLACSVEKNGENTPETFAPPDQLTLIRTDTLPSKQTYVLLDFSKSNRNVSQMKQEVKALVAKIPATEEVCLVQISEDSRSSTAQPWCRKPLSPFTCELPPIKMSEFETTREEAAYKEAKAKLEAEQAACEVERSAEQARLVESRPKSLATWFKGVQLTGWTDITGALSRASQMIVPDVPADIWLYTDMEQDLKPGATATEPSDLLGATIHVRLLSNPGNGGSAGKREEDWKSKFATWQAGDVDWKDFYTGEHSAE